MKNPTPGLLKLPDEILVIILNKLSSIDVLYSLLNSTERLDHIARSIDYSKSINFSVELSNGQLTAIDPNKLHRFCVELLPQIHHHIQTLTLEPSSIERILLAAQFPNLDTIVLAGFSADMLLHYFKSDSSTAHLLRKQIKSVTVKIRNELFGNDLYTDVYERILSICPKCTYLDMYQPGIMKYSKVSFEIGSRQIFHHSYLHRLSIHVRTFDDCLYLLDGRLKNLSSLRVRMFFIDELPTVNDCEEKLPNMKEFSLTCYRLTLAYDCRIVRLLHRMIYLEKLTLSFNAMRSTMIDGIDLNEKILCHLLNLDTFVCDICTIMTICQTNDFSLRKDLQNTFIHWKYDPVACSVDPLSNGLTYCHIYSIPYQMPHLINLTNSIRHHNHYFQFVITLILHDIRPFEHHFFKWMSKAVPRVKYLTVINSTPQSKRHENESMEKQSCISSVIAYNHLVQLEFIHAHTDYVDQFLCSTKAYVPQLNTLEIQYEKLVLVTNNFTNDATRINCSQLKQLRFNEFIAYPEHFPNYFPSLILNSHVI